MSALADKFSRERRDFVSPMAKFDDSIGPLFVPIWQPALAALAAFASIGFAILLYTRL
jgi:hypothetical protein